jgi:hypothetical protein
LRPLFGRWRWLSSAGKAGPAQAEPQGQKPRHRQDPFSVGTDSTRALTVTSDVELGTLHTSIYAGSTKAGSATGECGQDPNIKVPSPMRVSTTAVSPAPPALQPAPQCQSTTFGSRSDDKQHSGMEASVAERSDHRDPSCSPSPATRPGDTRY